MSAMIDLSQMNEQELREFTQHMLVDLNHKQSQIEKLTFEIATLKRLKFGAKSEAFNVEQRSLLDEALDEDLEAACLISLPQAG